MILKDQISDKDIERSLWLINNKKKIIKIIILILIFFCVILYAISTFGFIKFFTTKDINLNNFSTINFSQNKKTPNNLTVGDKQLIDRGNGKYDIAITINNPNEFWGATEIKYSLIIDGIEQTEDKTFIMPQETKKIAKLGINSETRIKNIDIIFKNIIWKKIKANEIQNFKKQSFEVKDLALNINPEDRSIRNWAEFSVKNISPYNFKNTKFIVFLYVGSQIVAINEIGQNYFKSEETRKLQTSWYYILPSYATAEIQTEVNLIDKNNYFLEN
ncbi:MAG: hypothetical protein PHH83_03900 [Patescibacteria group bacterium]|nr:hypothetical protein [Patescibacteria group bacterium]